MCVLALLADNRCSLYLSARTQLTNVVATVSLDCKPDLKSIALGARNAEYNPRRCVVLACVGVRACVHGWMGGECLGTVNYIVRHHGLHWGADP